MTAVDTDTAPPVLDGFDITHVTCCESLNDNPVLAFCGRDVTDSPTGWGGAACLKCFSIEREAFVSLRCPRTGKACPEIVGDEDA